MNEYEKDILQQMHVELMKDLEPETLMDYLYSKFLIDKNELNSLCEEKTRQQKCRELLINILVKFPMESVLEGLEHAKGNCHLAHALRVKMVSFHAQPGKVSAVCNPDFVRISHKLSRGLQDADWQKVKHKVFGRWEKCDGLQSCQREGTTTPGAVEADKFVSVYHAEIERLWSNGNGGLDDKTSSLLCKMESLIPYTSNPTATSMAYLTRLGSAVAVQNGVPDGMRNLEFAKQHMEFVKPGWHTGLVYFTETDLLGKLYENSPTTDLRERILHCSCVALSHFAAEPDEDLRNTFNAKLHLKMAFYCLKIQELGISFATPALEDCKEAKNFLDFVQDYWYVLNPKEKLLFHIAQANRFFHSGVDEHAVLHTEQAQQLAAKGNFSSYLSLLEQFLEKISRKTSAKDVGIAEEFSNIMNEIFSDDEEEDMNVDP